MEQILSQGSRQGIRLSRSGWEKRWRTGSEKRGVAVKMGKVWLVGAGPSDAGLLTLKGKAVLGAELIVYDRLVGAEILFDAPPEAEQIDVGKRAGSHTLPQEEINRLFYFERPGTGVRLIPLERRRPILCSAEAAKRPASCKNMEWNLRLFPVSPLLFLSRHMRGFRLHRGAAGGICGDGTPGGR